MSLKNNYKAKWLAALSDKKESPTEAASTAEETSRGIVNAHIGTTIELKRLQTTMIDAAANARRLVSLLDEAKTCAGIEFGEAIHTIDGKLTQMDLITMARRFRDIFKIAEARIGFLSAACENLEEANGKLHLEISTTSASGLKLQNSTLETLVIGVSPTRSELEDFSDSERKGRRSVRFGCSYDDLDADWMDTQLTSTSMLSERRDGSSSDESDDEATHRQIVQRHRQARITPTIHNDVPL